MPLRMQNNEPSSGWHRRLTADVLQEPSFDVASLSRRSMKNALVGRLGSDVARFTNVAILDLVPLVPSCRLANVWFHYFCSLRMNAPESSSPLESQKRLVCLKAEMDQDLLDLRIRIADGADWQIQNFYRLMGGLQVMLNELVDSQYQTDWYVDPLLECGGESIEFNAEKHESDDSSEASEGENEYFCPKCKAVKRRAPPQEYEHYYCPICRSKVLSRKKPMFQQTFLKQGLYADRNNGTMPKMMREDPCEDHRRRRKWKAGVLLINPQPSADTGDSPQRNLATRTEGETHVKRKRKQKDLR